MAFDERVYRVELCKSTAYHEAGHAVAAVALGVEVLGMHLYVLPNRPTAEDRIQRSAQVQISGLQSIVPDDQITIDVAGQVAEMIAGHRKRLSWRPNKKRLAELASARNQRERVELMSDGDRVRDNPGAKKAVRRAETILRENWPAVEVVAKALLDGVGARGHQSFTGDQILTMIRTAGCLQQPEAKARN